MHLVGFILRIVRHYFSKLSITGDISGSQNGACKRNPFPKTSVCVCVCIYIYIVPYAIMSQKKIICVSMSFQFCILIPALYILNLVSRRHSKSAVRTTKPKTLYWSNTKLGYISKFKSEQFQKTYTDLNIFSC